MTAQEVYEAEMVDNARRRAAGYRTGLADLQRGVNAVCASDHHAWSAGYRLAQATLYLRQVNWSPKSR